jgi:hypothetical protein
LILKDKSINIALYFGVLSLERVLIAL